MGENAFPDALPPQHRLHWYVFERVLGQGGFGITYLARDTNLDQPVAIKEYLPVEVATRRPDATVRARTDEQGGRFQDGLGKFIREARTLARFDHPNVVRVHSVFEANSTAYMVMRFEEGETLAALLKRRQALPEADLMRLLLPILDGLELVHDAGFIHRDIKPDNILIRSDGSSVLLDFGSARYTIGQARTLTILVAPGYAPFEQYYSDGENQGAWTDIYSLAATCYCAIAGRAPLDAISRSKGILGSSREILLPAAVVGSGRYSDRLLKAVDRALSFAERERPQTIAEWRRDLVGKDAAALAPTLTLTAAPTFSPAPAPAATVGAAAIPAKRGSGARAPMVWAGATGAAVVIAALAIVPWIAARMTGEAPPPAAAPAPPPDAVRVAESRRLAMLEQKLTEDRKELLDRLQQAEAERKRLEEERSRPKPEAPKPVSRKAAKPVAPAPPVLVAAPAPPAPLPARVEPSAPPPSAPTVLPAPAPTPAEILASGDRAQARGDVAEALRLFERAWELGDSVAPLRLGDMHATGHGMTQDNTMAYIWYSIAARAGNAAATASRARVESLLQPSEIKQADKVVEGRLAKRR